MSRTVPPNGHAAGRVYWDSRSDFSQAIHEFANMEVLVVDDEPLICWSLRRGLRQRGHIVSEAGTATDALKLISAEPNRYDAVVLDYRLPDRQDLTLLADVRHLAPNAAVLMMTAYGDKAMRDEALELGAAAVVDKPFQVDAFVSLVESALQR